MSFKVAAAVLFIAGSCSLAGTPAVAFAAEGTQPGGIRIAEAVICRGVVDRKPVEAGEIFSRQVGKLYCFTRVVGAPEKTAVTHTWYFGDSRVTRVRLPVGSANWRTFSATAVSDGSAGQWHVDVQLEDGTLLQRIYFMVH